MFPTLSSLLIFSSLELSETNQAFNGIEVCNFYEEAENKFNCGPSGFLIKIGVKYWKSTFDAGKIKKYNKLINLFIRFL